MPTMAPALSVEGQLLGRKTHVPPFGHEARQRSELWKQPPEDLHQYPALDVAQASHRSRPLLLRSVGQYRGLLMQLALPSHFVPEQLSDEAHFWSSTQYAPMADVTQQ